MLNFILPILKNPLTRIVADKTIGAIQHKMEKNKIIRAKEIEAEKSVSIEQIKQQSCRHRMMHEIDMIISKMRQSLYHFQPFPSSSFALTTTDGELVVFGALYDDQSGGIYGANCVHAEWWKNLQYKQKHECLIRQLDTLRDKKYLEELWSSNNANWKLWN